MVNAGPHSAPEGVKLSSTANVLEGLYLVRQAHEKNRGHQGAVLGAQDLQPRPDGGSSGVAGPAHHAISIPAHRHHLHEGRSCQTLRWMVSASQAG